MMIASDYKHFGRTNGPDASASVRWFCGDELEFYLIIRDNRITEVLFYTEGCGNTRDCAEAASILAEGGTIDEVMEISPAMILKLVPAIPEDHTHCAIQASMALHKAVADYLYRVSES